MPLSKSQFSNSVQALLVPCNACSPWWKKTHTQRKKRHFKKKGCQVNPIRWSFRPLKGAKVLNVIKRCSFQNPTEGSPFTNKNNLEQRLVKGLLNKTEFSWSLPQNSPNTSPKKSPKFFYVFHQKMPFPVMYLPNLWDPDEHRLSWWTFP